MNKLNDYLSGILEAGCFYIQNYVITIAVEKIENDEFIKKEIEIRKKGKHQENVNYKSNITQKILQLPEQLKPSMNGLTSDQFKIYEDFEKINNSSNINVNMNNNISNSYLNSNNNNNNNMSKNSSKNKDN